MTTKRHARFGLVLAAIAAAWLPRPSFAGERGGRPTRPAARSGLAWLVPVRGGESEAASSVAMAPDGSILVAGQFDEDLTDRKSVV